MAEETDFIMKQYKNLIYAIVAVVLAATVWFMPEEWLFLGDISVTEHRMAAIFVFTALFWVLEPVPAWVTSITSMLLMLFTVSTGGLDAAMTDIPNTDMVSYTDILISFADPVIIMFIGGFVIAEVASVNGLDKRMAKIILKPFGTKPKWVLLGLLLSTAAISMFVSDTATAAMMVTMVLPIIKSLPAGDKGKTALALTIALGSTIGGVGTPIGTPPNAIALKYLNDPAGLNMNIGFGQWALVMIPVVIIVAIIAWLILVNVFPFTAKEIKIDTAGTENVSLLPKWKHITIITTVIVTIVLWVTDRLTGLETSVVALIPPVVFGITGIFTSKDLKSLDWSVLWMFSGGFALGTCMEKTGLATHFVQAVPFSSMPVILMVVFAALMCWSLSVFISNTATAAMMMPIMMAVGMSNIDALAPWGGVTVLLISIALAASFAFVLPVSTPANSIAYSTGAVQTKQMAWIGIAVGLIAMTLSFIVLFCGGYRLMM